MFLGPADNRSLLTNTYNANNSRTNSKTDLAFTSLTPTFSSESGSTKNISEFQRRGGEKYNKRRSIEDWEISHDKVTFNEQIGHGSFGTVYKAHYFGMFNIIFGFYSIVLFII